MNIEAAERLAEPLGELVIEEFTPHFDELSDRFADNAKFARLAELGTQPWLDSGDIGAIGRLWSKPLAAVTTNNTLLNNEVQKGLYDELIGRAAALIRTRAGRRLSDRELALEIAFVLNARHALRLVEAFDACVSVEEHTALAHDVEGAVHYAKRYHDLCPQRFFVKIPLTPAGLIAARRCGEQGIPVNLTLGFSARQNYLAVRFARPRFVNVFLGRLNAFVADNELGDGRNVGEKALLASQRAMRRLRQDRRLDCRQIAASIRDGAQVVALAGTDVITMPTASAEQFLADESAQLSDRTGDDPAVTLAGGVEPEDIALSSLWDIPDTLADACDELDEADLSELHPTDLVRVLQDHSVEDLLVNWTGEQIQTSRREGKIPDLVNWQDGLLGGRYGLDALMNLAGLNSFAADQEEMDDKAREVLERT